MANTKEIRVRVTEDEEAEIRASAKLKGFRYPAEFLRVAGLAEARKGGASDG